MKSLLLVLSLILSPNLFAQDVTQEQIDEIYTKFEENQKMSIEDLVTLEQDKTPLHIYKIMPVYDAPSLQANVIGYIEPGQDWSCHPARRPGGWRRCGLKEYVVVVH